MRVVRAFSSSAPRAKQALFHVNPPPLSTDEKNFVILRKRGGATVHALFAKDSSAIRGIFHTKYEKVNADRSVCALRVAGALAKLQDSESFRVQDLSIDKVMGSPTINYGSELAIIDLRNPLGIPPDMAQQNIPPIYDRRRVELVAKALSDAGLLGTKQPPAHIPRGGFVPPPRIHVEDETLGTVTLTLPGATVQPFFNFLLWFRHNNPEFKVLNEIVTIWARSHGFDLSPQAIALMVLGAMQSKEAPFRDGVLDNHGWADLEYSQGTRWNRIAVPVAVDFTEVQVLPPGERVGAAQFITFFRHWTQNLYQAHGCAFTVRNGRFDAAIPREYTETKPRGFQFPKSSVNSPTRNFTPWCHEPLIIQDPFLVTINHAGNLSHSTVQKLEDKFRETKDQLAGGLPLAWTFGTKIAAPGSAVEAKILKSRDKQRLLPLLEAYRPPEEDEPEDDAPTPFGLKKPSQSSSARSPIHGYHTFLKKFHTSSVSLAKTKKKPYDYSPIYPPKPVRAEKPKAIDGVRPEWGLNDSLASNPTFWRPGPEPLTLPARTSSPSTPPLLDATSHSTPAPPVRATRAGVAYKNSASRPKGFHTSASVRLNSEIATATTSVESEAATAMDAVESEATVAMSAVESSQRLKELLEEIPTPPDKVVDRGVGHASRRKTTTSVSTLQRLQEFLEEIPTPPEKVVDRGVDHRVLASRRKTMLKVEHTIQKVYGYEYKVENFGSTRYGVSVESSDLDMVILDPHRPHGAAPKSPRESEIYNVRLLAKVLKKAGFRIIETISAASVPIVKFSDPATGHSVDLNVNERLGLLNSDLIKRYCELNPLLITMIQYIKLWAKPLGLNSPGRKAKGQGVVTFSSYALTMMTIGFMQHRGLLPNLQEGLPPLQPGKLAGTFWLGPPRPACCDVRYNKMEGWKPPREVTVLELMQDWFLFWGTEYDYPSEMISIREGGRLLRPERGPGPHSLFNGMFWNIDPFIRTKNLTGNIDKGSINRFHSMCRKFAKMPDFARGSLPRPKGWFADGQLSELEALMMPVGVQKAEWVPVDALPLPWREIRQKNASKARKGKVKSLPVESTLWWQSTADRPGPWSAPPQEESWLDRSFEASEEPPPPFENAELVDDLGPDPTIFDDDYHPDIEDALDLDAEPGPTIGRQDGTYINTFGRITEPEAPPRPPPKATSGPGRPVGLQDEGFKFDESTRIDAFGRIMEPKRPAKIPLEQEEDEVGFGLK